MSATAAVVKDRLAQGEEAAPGEFIDLLDDVDEVDQLFEAYLSLRDQEHAPEENPAPLTTEVMKSYVRLIYDAIGSTDEAEDAFNVGADGQLKKTGAMKYVDELKMLEVQLVGARLVKTVHKVQSGTLSIPSWPILTALKLHKFKTFPARMDRVIEALKVRKSICKAMFFDELSMLQRVAMQPDEEANKKGTNATGNIQRDHQLQFARDNMPKDGKPGTATPGRGDGKLGQEADHKETDEEMAPPKSKRVRRTPADVAVTINPVSQRAKKKPTAAGSAGSAEQSMDTDSAIQPAGPAAQAPVNNGGPSQPTASRKPTFNNTGGNGTAFTPINAGRSRHSGLSSASAPTNGGGSGQTAPSTPSIVTKADIPSQPATPTPVKPRGSKQGNNNLFVAPAIVNQNAQMQASLAAGPMGKGELLDTLKYPGPLGRPMAPYGDQRPQTAGPGVNELPPAYTPGIYYLPQQPQMAQSYGQYLPQQHQSPGNYSINRQASHGFQQGSPQRYRLPQANQQFQMQGPQGSITQARPYGRISQQDQMSGIQLNSQGPRYQHVDPAAGFQPDGRVVNFQQNGRVASIQQNCRMASVQHNGRMSRIRQNGSHSYIVNNYFQPPFVGYQDSQALPITQGEDDQYTDYERDMDYSQAVGPDQDLNDDQTIAYAKTSDNNPPVVFKDWVQVSIYSISAYVLDGTLTTALVIPHYSDLPSVELVCSAYGGRRQ